MQTLSRDQLRAAQTLSPAGRRFIEKWEERVLYVYDDKVAPRRIDGRRQYPEWDGAPVRGTLTIGYGHTDDAGAPKIAQGMRISGADADRILADDLRPVIAQVRRDVRVPLTPGQFDAMVSFCFNAGEGSLERLIVKLNRGDYDDIPRHLMQYVYSKGERMQGLANRRVGEVELWNTPAPRADAVLPLHEDEPDNFSPKAERAPAPKTMAESKSGAAAGTIGAGGAAAALEAAKDAGAQIRDAGETLHSLGLHDQLHAAAASPLFWIGIAIVALAAFVWWDRRRKLVNDHV